MALEDNGTWKKPKNVLIDLEDININEVYAITFNPCDKHQHFRSGQRVTECMKDIEDSIFYSMTVYTVELYPELSKSGRFHVHGYIRIHDPVAWCLHHAHHLVSRGTLVIKKITEPPEWKKYVKKQKLFHDYVKIHTFRAIPLKKGPLKDPSSDGGPGGPIN